MNSKVYYCVVNHNLNFTNNKNTIIFRTLEEATQYASEKCQVDIDIYKETVTPLSTDHIYEVKYGEIIDVHKATYYVYKVTKDFSSTSVSPNLWAI